MRCPSCSKFATFGTDQEPEADLEIGEGGQITGTVRIVLTSECCGDELKEASFDVEYDAEADIKNALADTEGSGLTPTTDADTDEAKAAYKAAREAFLDVIDLTQDGVEMEIEFSGEISDRLQDKDRHGRPIKNMRYAKHFWGFTGTATISVEYPVKDKDEPLKTTVEIQLEDEIESSAMEEMV